VPVSEERLGDCKMEFTDESEADVALLGRVSPDSLTDDDSG
jgi:hypothetical protein